MRKFGKTLAGILLALVICFGAVTATAEATMHREVDDPAIEMTAELGYQGMITYGKALPLRVRIRNNGSSDLTGTLGINGYMDIQRYNRFETRISVPAGTEQEFVLPFSVLVKQEIFTPEITVDGKVVEAVNLKPRSLANPSAMLVGVLSTKPTRLSGLNNNAENDTEYTGEYWQTVTLNADNFPDSAVLLDSFGIIVVDDIDPATLSRKQQEALAEWMTGRHVLLCSGTGSAVAYFSGWTGLEITGAVTSSQVLPKLETYINTNPSGKRPEVTVSRLAGADPLVSDDEGNGLLFRTETGNGRIYTTGFEMGASKLFTEKTLHYFWRKVLSGVDTALYSGMFYSYGDSSGILYPADAVTVPVNGLLLPAVLACAGAVILGCLLWFILKRSGKQTWMWLAVPVLSAAAAAAVLVISGASDLNRPMVTYADHVVQRADGTTTRYVGIYAAAPSAGMHTYELDGAPITMEYSQDYYGYYYYDEDQAPTEPVEMAMCYTTGDGEQLAMKADKPWAPQLLSSESAATLGKADAIVWMESDGLHGEIRNNTGLTLKAGKVITSYGYVSVPELKPGETAAFTLAENTQLKSGEFPKDGEMNRNGGYSLYGMTTEALGIPQDAWNVSGIVDLKRTAISDAMQLIAGSRYYDIDSSSVFLYTTEAAESMPLKFRVDGKAVNNASGMSVINVEMNYLPVGRTGVVYRMPGMDKAVRMTTDENGMPDQVMDMGFKDSYYSNYHSLSETPVFRFTVADAQEMEISRLQITLPSYYAQFRCSLLNVKTGAWDTVPVSRDIGNPSDYLNGEGMLFCRFEQTGSYDYDMDIPTPSLLIEGRKLNAEN